MILSFIMIFVMLITFLLHYFNKKIAKKNKPKKRLKLNFQKGFAFFNSINWKATSRNLAIENPIIKSTKRLEILLAFEIKAVLKVNKIKNP